MKTFFKRTAAAATGTVLALTQLAAAAVINVNAAESKKWDKAWLISVPVEDALKNEAIVSGDEVLEVTAPVTAGESKWNKDFEAGILAIAGSAAVDTTVAAGAVKTAVKRALKASGYASDAEAQAVADAFASKADVTLDDGETVVTLDIAECGKEVGTVIENMMRKTGCKMQNDLGGDIVIDWSAFKFSGKLTVTLTYTYDKNISYAVTFTDENGKKYDGTNIFDLAERKKNEASAVVMACAQEIAASYGIHDFTLEMGEFNDYADKNIARAKNGIKKSFAVSLTGTDLNETYADYLAAVEANFAGTRVGNFIGRRAPESVYAALNSSRIANGLNNMIGALSNVAGENVAIDLSASDLADIVTSGYNYDITIPNGASADLTFSIADDQNADLLAALQAVDEDVVSVTSHKEITLNVDNKTDGTGNAYFNVVRVIDAIKKVEVTETTTTETTTTESTTTESTTTESTTTESTTTESTTTESTTTESTTTESTTTETTTNSNSSSETTTTTESTTSSTTTTETTTTVSYSVEYRANGADLGEKVYWSEETVDFNLDGLKVALNIFKNGEKVDSIDVTSAFGTTAKNASELDFKGFGHYEIPFELKNLAAVRNAVVEAGYSVDDLGSETLVSHIKVLGAPQVALVLRGDMNLDNKVDVKDAQTALIYYAEMRVGNGIESVIQHSTLSEDQTLLPYEHYAADVFDGTGLINVQDSLNILKYYADHRLGYETAWTEYCGEVVVQPTLHSDPLANDAAAAAEVYGE